MKDRTNNSNNRQRATDGRRNKRQQYTPSNVTEIIEAIIKQSGAPVSIEEVSTNKDGTFSIKGITLG